MSPIGDIPFGCKVTQRMTEDTEIPKDPASRRFGGWWRLSGSRWRLQRPGRRERWEIETGYDEINTHMLEREESLRSKKPEGLPQEIWEIISAEELGN